MIGFSSLVIAEESTRIYFKLVVFVIFFSIPAKSVFMLSSLGNSESEMSLVLDLNPCEGSKDVFDIDCYKIVLGFNW